jgi:hypothetical protein
VINNPYVPNVLFQTQNTLGPVSTISLNLGQGGVNISSAVTIAGNETINSSATVNNQLYVSSQIVNAQPAQTYPNDPEFIGGNVNGYLQSNIQNTSSGNNSSSDYIATSDQGTDSLNYMDCGINSSGYSQTAYSITPASWSYCYSSDHGFAIGAGNSGLDAGAALVFYTSAPITNNMRMEITASGPITAFSSFTVTNSELVTSSLTVSSNTYLPGLTCYQGANCVGSGAQITNISGANIVSTLPSSLLVSTVVYTTETSSLTILNTAGIAGSINMPLTLSSSETINNSLGIAGAINEPLTVTSSTTLYNGLYISGASTPIVTQDGAQNYGIFESTFFMVSVSTTIGVASLQNNPGFYWTLPANSTWTFNDCPLMVTGAAGGVKWAITGPSGATVNAHIMCGVATGFIDNSVSALATATGTACSQSAATGWTGLVGEISINGTGGAVALQWEEGTVEDTITMLPGAHCTLTRVR